MNSLRDELLSLSKSFHTHTRKCETFHFGFNLIILQSCSSNVAITVLDKIASMNNCSNFEKVAQYLQRISLVSRQTLKTRSRLASKTAEKYRTTTDPSRQCFFFKNSTCCSGKHLQIWQAFQQDKVCLNLSENGSDY